MNRLSVSHLVWSEDAKRIACADLGGDIHVKRLISEAGSLKGFIGVESIVKPQNQLGKTQYTPAGLQPRRKIATDHH